MSDWLASNIGTIIVSLILVGIVAAIIVNIVKKKKAGRSSRGCGCENCAMKGACHK